MREAVIVSTARTPIGRAYRGAFNDTQAQAADHYTGPALVIAGAGSGKTRSRIEIAKSGVC